MFILASYRRVGGTGLVSVACDIVFLETERSLSLHCHYLPGCKIGSGYSETLNADTLNACSFLFCGGRGGGT